MKDLMNNAGNVLEELKEAESINGVKEEGIWTLTVECGEAWTILCC